jgi:hypothetical protein
MVPISYYIILSAILFTIGALGVLIRRNALIIFHVGRVDVEFCQPGNGCLQQRAQEL